MKKILLASVAAVAFCAAPALAADMPVKAGAAPVFNWSGFYAGINGGYGWTAGDPNNIVLSNTVGVLAATPGLEASGWFGGGQVGANWQRGAMVLGIEADIQGTNIKDNFSRVVDGAGDVFTASKKLDYFGTVRGRAGVAMDRLLIYATGGLAYGGIHEQLLVTNPTTPLLSANLNTSSTRTGTAWGGGAEWAFSPAWTLRVEYLYLTFTKFQLSAPVLPPNGTTIMSNGLDNNYQVVRAALNFKFGS
jgi:outer membrane immunogenic protein